MHAYIAYMDQHNWYSIEKRIGSAWLKRISYVWLKRIGSLLVVYWLKRIGSV